MVPGTEHLYDMCGATTTSDGRDWVCRLDVGHDDWHNGTPTKAYPGITAHLLAWGTVPTPFVHPTREVSKHDAAFEAVRMPAQEIKMTPQPPDANVGG